MGHRPPVLHRRREGTEDAQSRCYRCSLFRAIICQSTRVTGTSHPQNWCCTKQCHTDTTTHPLLTHTGHNYTIIDTSTPVYTGTITPLTQLHNLLTTMTHKDTFKIAHPQPVPASAHKPKALDTPRPRPRLPDPSPSASPWSRPGPGGANDLATTSRDQTSQRHDGVLKPESQSSAYMTLLQRGGFQLQTSTRLELISPQGRTT